MDTCPSRRGTARGHRQQRAGDPTGIALRRDAARRLRQGANRLVLFIDVGLRLEDVGGFHKDFLKDERLD